MFEQDAKWIYDKTIPGDVVLYENTGGTTVQSWNGAGGLWNIPWDQWLKKSALGSGGAVDTADVTVELGRDLAGGERLSGFDAATSVSLIGRRPVRLDRPGWLGAGPWCLGRPRRRGAGALR